MVAPMFAAYTLATAVCLAALGEARQPVKRQAPVLPSSQYYINATRNDRSPVTLQINTNDTTARNDTSPYLYGLMFEVSLLHLNTFRVLTVVLGHQPLWRWWYLCRDDRQPGFSRYASPSPLHLFQLMDRQDLLRLSTPFLASVAL